MDLKKPTVRLKAAKLLGTIPASKWLEVVSQIQSKAISQENKSKHDLNSNITIGQITRGLESVHTFFMTRKHLISMSIMLHSAFLPDLVDICGEFSPEVAQVLKRISIAYALIDTGISDSMKYLEGALAIQTKIKNDEEICKLVLLKAQILNDLQQKEDAIKTFEEAIQYIRKSSEISERNSPKNETEEANSGVTPNTKLEIYLGFGELLMSDVTPKNRISIKTRIENFLAAIEAELFNLKTGAFQFSARFKTLKSSLRKL